MNLMSKFVWLSPINWVDLGDDPMDPDPSFDNFPIHFGYPSFELPGKVLEAKEALTYGSPRHLELVSQIQARRLGAPLAASPTRTAKRVPVGSPAAQRSESSSLPPTPGRGKKKSQCPKGHYWSYKHKKCMKSKF